MERHQDRELRISSMYVGSEQEEGAPEKIMGMLRAFCIHLDMATDSFGIGNRDMVCTLYLKRSIVHVRHTGRP